MKLKELLPLLIKDLKKAGFQVQALIQINTENQDRFANEIEKELLEEAKRIRKT